MAMNQWGGAVLALAATVTLVLSGPTAGCRAADRDDAAAPEFAFVPADAAVVASVRFGDLWNNEALRPVRDRWLKQTPEPANQFRDALGVDLAEVDRLTVVGSPGDSNNLMWFVTTTRPYDRQKVEKTIAKDADIEKLVGGSLYIHGDHAAYLLDDHTLALGSTDYVRGEMRNSLPSKAC